MCVSGSFSVPSVVFWFGDLNFRIEDYDIHVVKCAIDSNKLPLLLERDQVRQFKWFAPMTLSQALRHLCVLWQRKLWHKVNKHPLESV